MSQPDILVSMADICSQDFILRPVTQHRHPISQRAARLHERRHKTKATRKGRCDASFRPLGVKRRDGGGWNLTREASARLQRAEEKSSPGPLSHLGAAAEITLRDTAAAAAGRGGARTRVRPGRTPAQKHTL